MNYQCVPFSLQKTKNEVKKASGLFSSIFLLAFFFILSIFTGNISMAEDINYNQVNDLYKQGNYAEALKAITDYYQRDNSTAAYIDREEKCPVSTIDIAMDCMRRLNKNDQIDEFLEQLVSKFPENSRVLQAVARAYESTMPQGYRVDNKFKRGNNRSGGELMFCDQRDRVRSLQLMLQAEKNLDKSDYSDSQKGEFYLNFARCFSSDRGGSGAWQFQGLTDINTLPDYQSPDNYYGRRYYGRPVSNAPVDEAGNPIFYALPESFAAAVSDGERWRFLLSKAEQYESSKQTAEMARADFARSQFGVQTIAGVNFQPQNDSGDNQMASIFKLETLSDDETIARLATGIKRFQLPDDYNFIKIYQQNNQLGQLAQIYLNRRQYNKSAEYWKKLAEQGDKNAKLQYEQIVNPWGRFDGGFKQKGLNATIPFIFRNATMVRLTTTEINVQKLLEDAKNALRWNPSRVDYEQINLDNIAYRLIHKNQDQYKGKQVADWAEKLEPQADHFDTQVELSATFPKPGAYLIEANIAGGNTIYAVCWVYDTVITRKAIDGGYWYFVADCETGEPVPNATLDFFGFRQNWNRNKSVIKTTDFVQSTDENGQCIIGSDKLKDFQWLTVATGTNNRTAFMGFSQFYFGQLFSNQYDQQYNAVRVYTVTDRPVYRPGQKVSFKFWARRSQYDKSGADFAQKNATLRINNPRGEQILEKEVTLDQYGGFASEIELPSDAILGNYGLNLFNQKLELYGNNSFRVEEYKKPEYSVEIQSPVKPVALGEKVKALVQAKYYFGEPVSSAKAKIKVTRSEYNDRWFPVARWDWLFGKGYWWRTYEYPWYPGWNKWGCCCPYPYWYNFPNNPPEVVYEQEVDLKSDGTFEVEIDTSSALAQFGKQNQKYEISAEVTDASRHTIYGKGNVLVSAEPFKVYAWLDQGVYQTNSIFRANFQTQTLDCKPVKGTGIFNLYQIKYDENRNPVEKEVYSVKTNPDDEGKTEIVLKLNQAGQFRAEYTVDDGQKHICSGAQLFTVRGEDFDSKQYRFANLEIIPDKETANPGDKVTLTINVDKSNAVVWLFPRAANGVCIKPERVKMNGKSGTFELNIEKRDMPNFFVEAVTVADNQVFSETRQICVPPEKRILSMEVIPDKSNYKPGEDAKAKIVLKDLQGNPFVGQTVVTIYDKSLEYISGGSNAGDIAEFFWSWKRNHNPSRGENSLRLNLDWAFPRDLPYMKSLGVFGDVLKSDLSAAVGYDGFGGRKAGNGILRDRAGGMPVPMAAPRGRMNVVMAKSSAGIEVEAEEMDAAPMAAPMFDAVDKRSADESDAKPESSSDSTTLIQPTIRTNFADSAFWTSALQTNEKGEAEISLKMPENLTTWKIKAWAMGAQTEVGEATTEVITRKNLIIRAQTPRFLVQNDKIVLSAVVHNYLDSEKPVQIKLETDGSILSTSDAVSQNVTIPAGGQTRVDWTVNADNSGEAVVRMLALTDQESDAMEVKFPVVLHGILKQDSFSGVIKPEVTKSAEQAQAAQSSVSSQKIEFTIPQACRPEQTRLEVRYSPTLAGAMLDAIPYLADYPYGCTEQTLNKFLPAVITQKVLTDMGLDLEDIQNKKTNFNAQEIGEASARAKQWDKLRANASNPVFDKTELEKRVNDGIDRLTNMQCSDGGWGWFSGFREYSYPHTTAVVIHGLVLAKQNGCKIDDSIINRGLAWLEKYQAEQVQLLQNALIKEKPDGLKWKNSADNLDAFVYTVLIESRKNNAQMGEFLYRDRTQLSPYALAIIGLAFDLTEQIEKRDMCIRNLTQYLNQDDENQTAWLDLGSTPYWYWYGSEIEAQAWYLKLLCKTNQTELASRLVKYLLNNRKHATYWNSTRDTALVLEAFAQYLKTTGEMSPDMTVELILDGKTIKTVKIDKTNLFTFDGTLILQTPDISAGKHTLEIKRTGSGPVYFNAYVNYFTMENFIPASGLEIKVQRKYYKLVRDESASENSVGSRGQIISVKTDKYIRQELESGATIKSGDIILVDLTLESKNDYEYLVFEDRKPAGFEPLEVRSGYNGNEIGAYVEFRDQKVSFFCRQLPRGKCSVSYKLKAEMPGTVSALPASGEAMYAPELKANSNEFKISTVD